jgi:uncharacterized protein (TIGR03083 family)
MPEPDRAPIAALRSAHDLLARLVDGMGPDAAGSMSYCSEWTIAQVLAHIGSGAEIGLEWLAAVLERREPMSQDEFPKIWKVWNERPPMEQVVQGVAANSRLVAAYESASAEQLTGGRVTLFGMMEVDGYGLAMFRLPEAAVHTWDVAVALDPSARVLPDTVDLLIDQLPGRMGWMAKPQGRAWSVTVETSGPSRTFTLTSGDAVSLAPGAAASPDGVLRLTAEAFIRLTSGRLDDTNADGAEASGAVALDELRATFPGF